jgi:ABC-type Fe3+-siderophore transport system permease subunit/ABC-type Fe3+-hydroxamate transport system substrate-binding protein
VLLAAIALAAFAARLTIGPSTSPWGDVWRLLVPGGDPGAGELLREFRLPQALAAALVGAALAVSGLQMQTIFQNPLAGPWALGLVAGSQLAVAALIVSGAVFGVRLSGALSPVSLSGITLAAGIGSACALAIALKLARHVGPATLLICGLLASATADGVRGFLIHLVDIQYELLFLSWNQAGFGGITWVQLRIFAVAVAIGLALAVALAKSLNGLLLGHEYARSVGINLTVTRRLSMVSTVLLAGAATAFSGAVLFIDLAVPHLCRGLFRTADHRFLVPATALTGAIVALVADSMIGLMPGDAAVPINIILCLLGGPVVLWVLLRGERGGATATASTIGRASAAVFALLAVLAATGCVRTPESPRPSSRAAVSEPTIDVTGPLRDNIRDGRVREYRADLDYFPEKTTFRYTRQLAIEYHGHYKILTVTPAPNPKEQFRYVLVQRGTPAPSIADAHAHVIEVPLRNFILTHDELLGAAEIAGLADRLIAVSSVKNIRAPGIRAGIDAHRIVGVGSGKHLDVERVIQLQPDVVMTYWSVNPSYDAHPVLDQAGIDTVVLSSHWETTLLATAEWMKVMAILFNREGDANQVFDGIVDRYERLAARARAAPTKPLVIMRLPFRHIWYVTPEPDEIAAAGGQYFWPGETRIKGVDIEAVAQKGRGADAWIMAFPTPMRSIDDLLAREPRLMLFDAVRRGKVWNQDLQEVDPQRPYADLRMRPDLVLADLVKILHPELVPDHELVFYRQWTSAASLTAFRLEQP